MAETLLCAGAALSSSNTIPIPITPLTLDSWNKHPRLQGGKALSSQDRRGKLKQAVASLGDLSGAQGELGIATPKGKSLQSS